MLSVGEDVGAPWLSSVGVFVVGCHYDRDGGSVLHRAVGAGCPGGDAFALQGGAWVVACEDVGADGVEQCGLGEQERQTIFTSACLSGELQLFVEAGLARFGGGLPENGGLGVDGESLAFDTLFVVYGDECAAWWPENNAACEAARDKRCGGSSRCRWGFLVRLLGA